MRKGKRILSLLVSLAILLIGFGGCGSDGGDKGNTASETTAATVDGTKDETGVEPAVENDPMLKQFPGDKVKVVTCCIFPEQAQGLKMDYLQERFGIEFEIRALNLADWNTQISTWVSSGDSPDLVWWDVNNNTSNMYMSWTKQGSFRPITQEMIDKRPNLAKKIDENRNTFDAFRVDGELYYWPCFVDYPKESNNAATSASVWTYRRDWAKAVGLYKEGDVYTMDEWLALTKAVIEQDPGKNGPSKTIGLLTPPGGWPTGLAIAQSGVPTTYYKGDDGKYSWGPATPEFKETVILTKKIYDEGLVSKDNAAWKSQESYDNFAAGLGFAFCGAIFGFVSSNTNQLYTNKAIGSLTEDAVATAIVTYKGKFHLTESTPYWTGFNFSSKMSDLAMNRVLNMADFLTSEDGARFFLWGRPDVDYKLNADGKIKILWEQDPEKPGQYKTPDGYGLPNYWLYMIGGQHMDVSIRAPELLDKELSDLEKLTIKDTEEMMKLFKYPYEMRALDYKLNFLSTPQKDLYGDFNGEVVPKIAELISTSKDIGADWDAYIASIIPRVQPVLDEINAAIGDK